MRAMSLRTFGSPLVPEERPDPLPQEGEVRLQVLACAVCRADVHIVDGALAPPRLPVVPGHEIVGLVDALHPSVTHLQLGQRVGLAWMAGTCGHCRHCVSGHEHLCEKARYTGFHRDGGFATHVIADARYCFALDQLEMSAVSMAPLLCGGITGWHALKLAGEGRALGLYGFGASAQFVVQVATQQGREVHVFTKPGDTATQAQARALGAACALGSDERAATSLDACIVFAPVGALLPAALAALRRGGRVVCASLHTSDVPSFPFELLTFERQLVTATNYTRRDAHEFLALARHFRLAVETVTYPLERANDALQALRIDAPRGIPVLVP